MIDIDDVGTAPAVVIWDTGDLLDVAVTERRLAGGDVRMASGEGCEADPTEESSGRVTTWVGSLDVDGQGTALRSALMDGDRVLASSTSWDRICVFVDDARRLGGVEIVTVEDAPSVWRLSCLELTLLAAIGEGSDVTTAARAVGVSHRTADRRLATARSHLDVETTAAAAVRVATRLARLSLPSGPCPDGAEGITLRSDPPWPRN